MKKEEEKKRASNDASQSLVYVLAVISILGFSEIISETIFNYKINDIVQSLWLIFLGLGIISETKFSAVKTLGRGLNKENFPQLTTEIVGLLAVLAGIFSLPSFGIVNPAFHAVRGIMSIIGIFVIFVDTWVVRH